MNNENAKMDNKINKIAIFASGSGTNAENIVRYFSGSKTIQIALILTNKPDAFVIERGKNLGIPVIVFNKDDFYQNSRVLNILKTENIDWVILAGFLWLIPQTITHAFENKIVNIHPALLPDFGGKGMYGDNVHKKVIESGRTESGITIHFVNEKYDEGNIIFQAKCNITKEDTYESLAKKIHLLEYEYFPKVIENIILS